MAKEIDAVTIPELLEAEITENSLIAFSEADGAMKKAKALDVAGLLKVASPSVLSNDPDFNLRVSESTDVSGNKILSSILGSGSVLPVTYSQTDKINSDSEVDGLLFKKRNSVYYALNFTSLNVKDIGAKGDGVTDDANAINAGISFLNAIGGGRLYFPDSASYACTTIKPKSDVWIDFGTATILKFNNTGFMVRAVENKINGSYYGTYKNIKLTGGYFDGNGKTGGNILMIWQENLTIDGITIKDYSHNSGYAITAGGRNLSLTNGKIFGGANVGEDGVHILHGSDINVSDWIINSGDDCVALGGEIDFTTLAETPEGISNVNVSNIVGNSVIATGIKVYRRGLPEMANPAWFVKNVTITNYTGKAGIVRNGGIFIQDEQTPSIGNEAISNITVSAKMDVGSSTRTDINSYGIYVKFVKDIIINDSRIDLFEPANAASGFICVFVEDVTNFQLNNFVSRSQGKRSLALVRRSTGVKFNGIDVVVSNSLSNDAIQVIDSNFEMMTADITNIPASRSGLIGTTVSGNGSIISLKNATFKNPIGTVSAAGYGISKGVNGISKLVITGNDFSGMFNGQSTFGFINSIPVCLSKDNLNGLDYFATPDQSDVDAVKLLTYDPLTAKSGSVLKSKMTEGNIVPDVTLTRSIGTAAKYYNNIYVNNIASQGIFGFNTPNGNSYSFKVAGTERVKLNAATNTLDYAADYSNAVGLTDRSIMDKGYIDGRVIIDSALTAAQTSNSLNTKYPSVAIKVRVVAPNVGTGMMYIKTAATTWMAISGTNI